MDNIGPKDMEALLKGLNAAQRAAVTSPASVLQVLAPPGSGKTKTLTSRVAYLLEHHGYAPWNVICCTFTIKASREMRERLRGIVGEREAKLQLGTFHSICRRYLVRYGHLIDIPRDFGIADSSDSLSIIKRAIKRLNLTIDPRVARSKISLKKSKGFRLADVVKRGPKTADTQEFHTVFAEYESALATSNLLDYDDLLIRCSDLLRAHPECVSNIEALLIDEFQDTNVIQFELMKLLASAQKRITIVGDPDQSIYGFRSAEIENLHRMRLAYPDTVVINLEENYRSTAAILELAEDVIELDTDRPDKKLKATHCYGTLPVFRKLPNAYEEARWIATEIKRTIAMTGGMVQHSDIAILLRSAFLSLKIEKELARNAIHYRMVGGHKFFDRSEIRILLGYLRTISQPDNDPALIEIINVPSRKIGEVTVKEWLRVSEQKKISLWAALQKFLSGELDTEKKMSKSTLQKLRELVDFIKRAKKKMSTMQPFMVPLELLTLILDHIKYSDYLKTKYREDHEDRWENVQELLSQATDFAAGEAAIRTTTEDLPTIEGLPQREVPPGEEILAQYLSNIVLSTEVETSEDGQDKPRVTISTIHSAKGLEWPVVFLPAVYEGSIPHSRAEDTSEERRLLYVAMTRAQALLNVTFPVMSSDHSDHIMTQFLPPQIASRFAQTAPTFCDSTVEGIAATIRRQSPSDTALVDVRLNLGGLESAEDDLWPADGSPRPFKYQDTATEIYESRYDPDPSSAQPGFIKGQTLEEVLTGRVPVGDAQSRRQIPPRVSGFTTAGRHMSTMTTTMDDLRGFSVASSSLTSWQSASAPYGRTDLNLESVEEVEAIRSKDLTARPRFQAAKPGQGQGKLADFFVQAGSKATAASAWSGTQLAKAEKPLVTSSIPRELSSHTLTGNSVSSKRPRRALEETPSPNRKKHYGFHSSSPGSELRQNDQATTIGGWTAPALHLADGDATPPLNSANRDENNLPKAGAGFSLVRRQMPEVKRESNPTFRPVVTLDTTSIAALSGDTPVRRTLGVRRTMNGWDNRRNK